LVVPHGHHDGALLCRQMGIDFRHGSTLQQRVLHLVLEAAQDASALPAIWPVHKAIRTVTLCQIALARLDDVRRQIVFK
ncbi:hypothetical protein, partial [Massilia sp. PWRC2]|uniref:hypothetical protein n=1 Tax=Massilia sp. PWRC2 TaxID=2804626 RepID=UPI003CE71E82